eukprot:scaffold109358_cov48-Phaeocystis_antarctica.AAC.2
MHRGSGRLVATEARRGCPCGGGDPARTDGRHEAQHDAKQRSHDGWHRWLVGPVARLQAFCHCFGVHILFSHRVLPLRAG